MTSMPAASPRFSVVIPVYNEANNLPELLRRCRLVCSSLGPNHEIILCDDGSRDRSREIIEEASREPGSTVTGVFLNRNYGQHAAVMAGLAQSTGEVVITLDADLQNPPEEIPRLLAEAERGADVVGSVRTPRQDSRFRRLSSWITNRAVRAATGVDMHDYGCMLRAYRRPIVTAMLACNERSTFIPILANSFARTTAEIEVQHAPRPDGASRYSLWKLINLQFDLLTSMTTAPLRLLSLFGLLLSLLGSGFGVLLLVLRLLCGAAWAAQGVFTLLAILFVFVGLQFIGLGLIGEYLGRVYHDVRARPRYHIDKITGRKPAENAP